MPAPIGNNYKMKYKTPEERQAACERLCNHLKQGLSLKCFECDDETIKRYITDFPEDFAPEKIEEAKKACLLFWEKTGIEGTVGKIDKFNATSWIFNMKNRFPDDWREKTSTEVTGANGKDLIPEASPEEICRRVTYLLTTTKKPE